MVWTEQSRTALARANEVRLARAELKRRVLTRQLNVAEILATVPPEVETLPVITLLMYGRGCGRQRAVELLARVPLPEQKTVGSMTERQRNRLAEMLGGGMGASIDRSRVVAEAWPGAANAIEALARATGGLVCEQHPDRDWPHDVCAGPGMLRIDQSRRSIDTQIQTNQERDGPDEQQGRSA